MLDEYREPAARERPRGLRPPVPRDRCRRAAVRSAARGRPAGARPRRRARQPHAAGARPRARPRPCRTRGSSSCRRPGHSIPLEAPQETADAIVRFVHEVAEAEAAARDGRPGVLRADTTPRNSREGPFGHLDVRWVVGAAHRRVADRVRPVHLPVRRDAREPPPPERRGGGHGRQRSRHAGRRRPAASTSAPATSASSRAARPHRITGTSEDEDLVILWAFGGAASIEQAGYVPLPDHEEKVQ